MSEPSTTGGRWPMGVSEWTLRETSTLAALQRIADAGFALVELAGRTDNDVAAAQRALASTGMSVTSICPLFGVDRDFASPVPGRRQAAADLLHRSVDYAQQVGAGAVIVVPSDTPDPAPGGRSEALHRAAEAIAAVAQTIPPTGPLLVIEPLNRSETWLINTLEQAAGLAGLIGSDRVFVMGDVFHMSIEEQSVAGALLAHSAALRHLHLADTARQVPGRGQFDFAPVFAALDAAGYRGSLVIEGLPAGPDDLAAARSHLIGLMPGAA